MLSIYDVDSARSTILQRREWGSHEAPPHLTESLERIFGPGVTPEGAVRRILESVHADGDSALLDWSETLDGVRPAAFRIPVEQLAEAAASLPAPLLQAMEQAIARVRAFHDHQPLISWTTTELGGRLGQRVTPVQRVGVYVPGGTAPLPSSLIMCVVPAQVAGVGEIIVCTPPEPHPAILAAAHLCRVEQVYQVGGAQAIAAMAYGTRSIPRVDKIVGPGNLFVTLAKRQVYGTVGLDGLAGPTETMIIADGDADPVWLSADLLAQAEHDPLASAILLTPARSLAEAVQSLVARQVETLSRVDILADSLRDHSGIVVTPDLDTAVRLANEFAPEHLCLAVHQPELWAEKVNNAGSIFLGAESFEVLGDYIAGPNHVLPTGGTARFASTLSVLDFVKIQSIIALDQATSRQLSPLAAELARAETLTAHAAAAEIRLETAQQPRGR